VSIQLKATLAILLIVFAVTVANYASSLFFIRQGLVEAVEKRLILDRDLANDLITTQIALLKSNALTVVERLENIQYRSSRRVPGGGTRWVQRLKNPQYQEEVINVMKTQLEEFPEFISLTIFSHDEMLVSYGDRLALSTFLNTPCHAKAFERKSVIFTNYCEPKIEPPLVFYLCSPMEDDLVLVATLPGQFFSDILSEYRIWQTGNIFIFDRHGTIIAQHDFQCTRKRINYFEMAKTDSTMQSASEFFQEMILTQEGLGTYFFHDARQICSYKQISASNTHWVLVLVAPHTESPVSNMQAGLLFSSLFFLVTGGIVAVVLSGYVARPFYKIAEQNRHLEELNAVIQVQTTKILEKHERAKILLDSMPLVAQLWSKENRILECNEEAVKVFNTKNKKEYIERFFEFSPKYQPDGQPSSEKMASYITKAFDEGRCHFEWTHQTSEGELIPTEVTLVRIRFEDDYVVAKYVRDLREYEQARLEIERRDYLLNTINRAAALLLQSETDAFENDLHQCMGMMAEAINIDRITIWKNHTIEGELHCTQLYEWVGNALPQQGNDFTVNVSYKKRLPGWEETLSRGNCINALVSEMSPEEQAKLTPQGIKSIFVLPIFLRDQFWGFIGYTDSHSERVFTSKEQLILRSGGLVIANAAQRHEMTLSLRETATQLEEALNEAKKANDAKSNFLAQMSHEIRTPLNAVVVLSTLALENEANDETRLNLEKIHNAGMTILSMVNDILDISKIEAGKSELILNEYDVSSLINDTITQNILRIGDKPIEFILNIDEHLPTHLYGDELKVKQILSNLLSNAFKYTREGIVELNLNCIWENGSVWLVARVRDTGIGIHPEGLDRLFSDYVQIDTVSNRYIEGTGLGLPLAKKMAEMMDGTISVESEFGKGSVFTVQLRQKRVTDATIGPKVAKNLKSFRYYDSKRNQNIQLVRTPMPYARVLVVDDIATNLDVMKGLLKPYKMHVRCVTSGQQAVNTIREEKNQFHAIFMDQMMSGTDGIEATRLIRQIGTEYAKNIPIIALTANAIIGNEEMFLKSGFQAFLSKPIDVERLDDILQHWVRDKTLEEFLSRQQAGKEKQAPPTTPSLKLFSNHRKKEEKKSEFNHQCNCWKIAGLNVRQGIVQYNNEGLYLDILRSFAKNTPVLLEKIRNVNRNNLPEYLVTIHGLKGSCRAIYAERAGNVAKTLEEAAQEGNFDLIKDYNAAFITTLETLIGGIEHLLQSHLHINPKPRKDKPDHKTLSKLLAACESYNMDEVDVAMAELERYEYEADSELVPWLRDNVDQVNFIQIQERIRALGIGNRA